MAVRNAKQKKPCTNCPQPTANIHPATTRPPQPIPSNAPVKVPYSLPMEEGLRLWKHVLFGTSTCLAMIEGYTLLEMPGNPLEGLVSMRDRLNLVITNLESRAHVPSDPSQQRPTPPGADHGEPRPLGKQDDAG